jgi:hypothetical protein
MRDIELQPTSTAHWHALVSEAESRSHQTLGEDLQSYLVFLLQRFLSRPELSSRVLALDYLSGLRSAGRHQFEKLREVGDICLLHAGFFPQRARRRRVNVGYYIDLGIGAYYQLHHQCQHSDGALYARLYTGFVPAMDVLQTIHTLGNNPPLLDPLTAHELWEHSGSRQAENRLRQISQGTPLATMDDHSKRH